MVSAVNIPNFLLLVRNCVMSFSCQSKNNTHWGEGAALTSRTNMSSLPCATLHSSITEYNTFLSRPVVQRRILLICCRLRGTSLGVLMFSSPPASCVTVCITALGVLVVAMVCSFYRAESDVRKYGALPLELPCGFVITFISGPSNMYCTRASLLRAPPLSRKKR